MGTITAHVLFGQPQLYHEGISQITHQMFLSENDRPAWILQPFGRASAEIVWIPTVERMLEDGLLMAAVHILGDRNLIRMLPGYEGRIEFYALPQELREKLYARCSTLEWGGGTAVITVLKGSTINRQLPSLNTYRLHHAICKQTGAKTKDQQPR